MGSTTPIKEEGESFATFDDSFESAFFDDDDDDDEVTYWLRTEMGGGGGGGYCELLQVEVCRCIEG